METKVRLGLFCLAVFISCFVIEAHGNMKGQGEVLGRLYEAKRSKSSGDGGIDTSPFKVSGHVDAAAKVGPQEGLKERDRIERLPGQPPVRFAQYGGYVTVDASAGHAFYYYFVEAQHPHPNSLPLILWLNGGPGCSSFGYGAMQELGPFRVNSDGKTLFKNNYAWNHAANVLFLESPAGVGFSYSNTSDIYRSGDKSTAEGNYVFLLNWLERFPEYKNRDFYISGESYGGHYVPQLAQTILYHNINANKTIINLKGIIIGNPAINDETDEMGMYAYYASHAITSYETFNAIQKYCSFSHTNYSQSHSDLTKCVAAMKETNNCISEIDIYNIYAPLCFSPNLTANPKRTSIHDFDPCSNDYVHAYLNRPDVQEALHANVTKLSYAWRSCGDLLFSWQDSADTIPLIQELMANGLHVWIYSGDTDGRLPVTSTQYSIEQMKLPVKTSWHPWFLRGEVGGYTQVYKGDLTFATVRGAGHQVPSYRPERALSLISHFLGGSPLPFH